MELKEALRPKSFLPHTWGLKRQEHIFHPVLISETPGPKTLLLVIKGPKDNLEISLKTEARRISLNSLAPKGTVFSVEAKTKHDVLETNCKEKAIKIPNGVKCDDRLIFSLLNAICRIDNYQSQSQELSVEINKAYDVLKEPESEQGALNFVEKYGEPPFKSLLSESKFSDKERQDAWETIARQERRVSQLTLNMIREMLPAINPIPNIRNYHQLTDLVNSTAILRTNQQIYLNITKVEGGIRARFSLKKEDVRGFFPTFLQKQIQPMRIYPTG